LNLGDGAAGVVATEYTYDANGSLISDGTTTYEYDAANRLANVDGVNYTWGANGASVLSIDPLAALDGLDYTNSPPSSDGHV
jgi:hypothetical protein